MAATPESGFLVIADLTGYTAYLVAKRARARAGDRGRPARDDRRPSGATVPAGEVRGRRRLPVRRGRPSRRVLAARRHRGVLRRLPAATPEHRPGDELRLQLVPPGARSSTSSCSSTTARIVRSRIAGRDELAGRDVILVHRLLKGGGGRGRAGTALRCSPAPPSRPSAWSPSPLGLAVARGDDRAPRSVSTFTLDLEARWQAESGVRRLESAGTLTSSSTSTRSSPPTRRSSGPT